MVKSTSGQFTTLYLPQEPRLGFVRALLKGKLPELAPLVFQGHKDDDDNKLVKVQDNQVFELQYLSPLGN